MNAPPIAPSSRPLSIAIIAAEESGDALGGALAQALRKREGDAVKLFGLGGRAMAAAGIDSAFAIDELSIIGLTAIPQRLPPIIRHIGETAKSVIAARPDVLVIVDSPDFTHRVARRVRRADPSIPIVDYVSPSVWAWRPGRARAMRAYIDHVLAILPFEPAVHLRLGGPPCTYVGHPLIERIAELRPNAEEAKRRLADPPLVLALPGSRSNEIHRHAGIFGRAIAQARRAYGPNGTCDPDRAACCRTIARRCRRLDGDTAHRGRAGGEMGGFSQRPRRACGIRHGDARTCAVRRADGRGLSVARSSRPLSPD